MSLFVRAFDSNKPQVSRGENGTSQLSAAGVQDYRVALFFALVRTLAKDRLEQLMQDVLRCATACPDELEGSAMTADLFVLMMQTRDCRGGKGERSLFYSMFIEMFKIFPATTLGLLTLVPEYGSYRDFFQIIETIVSEENKSTFDFSPVKDRILDLVANQLMTDQSALDRAEAAEPNADGSKRKPTLSMCAKYAPRESKHFSAAHKTLFRQLVERVFPGVAYTTAKPQYRKLCARLTAALNVTEVLMCSKRFAEIAFEHVPSLCAKSHRKAFLNEKIKGVVEPSMRTTGNRHPTDADRVTCRQHLINRAKEGKVQGKQLYPHEIVKLFMTAGHSRRGKAAASVTSDAEIILLEAQWDSMRQEVQNKLNAKREAGAALAIDLGKMVPLCDVSGSMNGEPMECSIALSLLVSEMNHPAFRNRIITFETTPKWVSFSDADPLHIKVQKAQAAPWGGSTDIEAAFALIEQVVRAHRLPASEIPDLIIFSDMQFDQAAGHDSQTQLQRIQSRFAKLGRDICGQPYPAPRIVFWNLRASVSHGFPASADSENVQMLSGYSPSLFKFVVEGEMAPPSSDEVKDEEDVMEIDAAPVVKGKIDPYLTLRKVLDDERYDAVRHVLSDSHEKQLAAYTFTPRPEDGGEAEEQPTKKKRGGGDGDTADTAMVVYS